MSTTRHPVTTTLLPAVVAGAVLGVVDLLWMTRLPYVWGQLANSSAVWAVAAFLLAFALRLEPRRAALAGTVLLLVAVEAYYVAAVLTDGASVAAFVSANTLMWLAFGVLAGVVFGVAGSWAATDSSWRAVAGAALAAGVLAGEGAVRLLHLQRHPISERGDLQFLGWATIVLGGVVLLLAARPPARLARAAALAVPAAALCGAGFVVAGFGI